jgi:hypothetical protein
MEANETIEKLDDRVQSCETLITELKTDMTAQQ